MEFCLVKHCNDGATFENQVTQDEWEALNNLLTDIRAKKKHEELKQKHKMEISFAISDAISSLGLEDTKQIVRELNRELRVLGAAVD